MEKPRADHRRSRRRELTFAQLFAYARRELRTQGKVDPVTWRLIDEALARRLDKP